MSAHLVVRASSLHNTAQGCRPVARTTKANGPGRIKRPGPKLWHGHYARRRFLNAYTPATAAGRSSGRYTARFIGGLSITAFAPLL